MIRAILRFGSRLLCLCVGHDWDRHKFTQHSTYRACRFCELEICEVYHPHGRRLPPSCWAVPPDFRGRVRHHQLRKPIEF